MIFKNDNIVILDAESKIKYQSSCYRLFILFIVGHISITSGLLQRAEKFGFSIVFMTHNLRVCGAWSNKANGNVILRKKQYEYSKLEIAQKIVKNKISNQLSILESIREKDDILKKAIENLEDCEGRLPDDSCGLKNILGLEGAASRIYFRCLFKDYGWIARRPRVKHDMTNCLLDIGYTLLFNLVEGLLAVYGFDLYWGVYHRQFFQRKSLVCDIVEPFRPVIDARVRKAYNLNQIKKKDFDRQNHQYNLFGKNAAPYVNWLLEVLVDRKQDIFLYIQSYYRAFMQGKKIIDYPCFLV